MEARVQLLCVSGANEDGLARQVLEGSDVEVAGEAFVDGDRVDKIVCRCARLRVRDRQDRRKMAGVPQLASSLRSSRTQRDVVAHGPARQRLCGVATILLPAVGRTVEAVAVPRDCGR